MTIQTVKFSQLRLSPLNVRRVKPSAIESMADDIAAHGLIQNLATYEEDGAYHDDGVGISDLGLRNSCQCFGLKHLGAGYEDILALDDQQIVPSSG